MLVFMERTVKYNYSDTTLNVFFTMQFIGMVKKLKMNQLPASKSLVHSVRNSFFERQPVIDGETHIAQIKAKP